MNQKNYQTASGNEFSVFAAKEAYRTIRTNLMFSFAKNGCKTILFTSSIQGEGKTTTSVNVAFSLARSNKKVLLLDLDLRRPRVHRFVKKPNSPGLTNYLSGFNSLEEVCHTDVLPNLDVICAGTISPNPAEIVASEETEKLLKSMKKKYDFIILDTPPVTVVSDSLSLIPQTDGVVLVIRPNYTTRKEARSAIDQIQFVGGKILGAVANAVNLEKKRGKKTYARYGYSRYGYGSYGANPETVKENTQSKQNPASEIEEQKEESESTE